MHWMWYVKGKKEKMSQMTRAIKIEKVGGGAGCWLYASGGQRKVWAVGVVGIQMVCKTKGWMRSPKK